MAVKSVIVSPLSPTNSVEHTLIVGPETECQEYIKAFESLWKTKNTKITNEKIGTFDRTHFLNPVQVYKIKKEVIIKPK